MPIHPAYCTRFVRLNWLLSSKARIAGQSSHRVREKVEYQRRGESNPSAPMSRWSSECNQSYGGLDDAVE